MNGNGAAAPAAPVGPVAALRRFRFAPVLAAIGQGTDVALANKESLVAAGDLVMAAARAAGCRDAAARLADVVAGVSGLVAEHPVNTTAGERA